MSDTGNVDLFDDLTDTTPTPVVESETEPVAAPEPETVVDDNTTAEETSADESTIETVSEIPAGAISITDFAVQVTQMQMRQHFEAQARGETVADISTAYVVPQAVYQTVKAKKDRIPHVVVKGPDDKEGRVYILLDEALVWWANRREHLATREGGSRPASSRTAEENLTLLGAAVEKALYAESRLKMWTDRSAAGDKLVDKYRAILADQGVAEDTIDMAVQEATDTFDSEQKAKADEKAAKSKKAGKPVSESDDDNE